MTPVEGGFLRLDTRNPIEHCDGAIEHQGQAVQLLSINGTYTVFGDMLLECQRVDQAIAAYQQAIELDPNEVRTEGSSCPLEARSAAAAR